MNKHFKCIGIVGHPRHPTALTTHEMLWRWLCSKGYEVLVEQQIAHELQLSNVKTGTLIGKNCKGEEKLRRIEQNIGPFEIRAMYTDDAKADGPLLAAAQEGYIVTHGALALFQG